MLYAEPTLELLNRKRFFDISYKKEGSVSPMSGSLFHSVLKNSPSDRSKWEDLLRLFLPNHPRMHHVEDVH